MSIKEYVKARRKNVADKTLRSHESALRTMFDQMNLGGSEPTPDDFREWLVNEKGKVKDSTLNQYCWIFLVYFRTLGLDGREEVKSIIDTMKPSVSSSEHQHGEMTEEEVRKTIELADWPHDLNFAIGYAFARRIGEVRRICARDVKESTITMPILKKEELRRVSFSLDLLTDERREQLLERRDEVKGHGRFEIEEANAAFEGETLEDPLFPHTQRQIQYSFEKASEKAGADEKSRNYHTLRHSRVRHLRNQGVPFDKIRELTRHETLSTLYDIYGRVESWKGEIPQSEV